MPAKTEGELINFMTTRWSLVRRAGRASAETRRSSLEALLQRYLPALRAHLTIDKKLPAQEAEDFLQGFITDKILEQNLVARADPARGKFRSFLLVALNRYVIDQHRREASAKRGGRAGAAAQPEDQLICQNAEPSEQFDRVWARELVAEALDLMRQECQAIGRPEIWQIFECRIVDPAFQGIATTSYEELIQKFGLESPLQAYNLLTTGKRMFARRLREAVAQTVEDEESIDAEINDLKSILARAGA